jgi:hypothetical protein
MDDASTSTNLSKLVNLKDAISWLSLAWIVRAGNYMYFHKQTTVLASMECKKFNKKDLRANNQQIVNK